MPRTEELTRAQRLAIWQAVQAGEASAATARRFPGRPGGTAVKAWHRTYGVLREKGVKELVRKSATTSSERERGLWTAGELARDIGYRVSQSRVRTALDDHRQWGRQPQPATSADGAGQNPVMALVADEVRAHWDRLRAYSRGLRSSVAQEPPRVLSPRAWTSGAAPDLSRELSAALLEHVADLALPAQLRRWGELAGELAANRSRLAVTARASLTAAGIDDPGGAELMLSTYVDVLAKRAVPLPGDAGPEDFPKLVLHPDGVIWSGAALGVARSSAMNPSELDDVRQTLVGLRREAEAWPELRERRTLYMGVASLRPQLVAELDALELGVGFPGSCRHCRGSGRG